MSKLTFKKIFNTDALKGRFLLAEAAVLGAFSLFYSKLECKLFLEQTPKIKNLYKLYLYKFELNSSHNLTYILIH